MGCAMFAWDWRTLVPCALRQPIVYMDPKTAAGPRKRSFRRLSLLKRVGHVW